MIVEENVGDRNDLEPWHKGEDLVVQVLDRFSNSKIVLIVLSY